jgi:predicted metal-dependent enzyme (double-stranded beta helix superfamily)
MPYTLKEFCTDCHDLLVAANTPAICLPEVAVRLGRLLANGAFVAGTFKEETPPGKQFLYHDPQTGFYVFAHVQQAGKGGAPHSHGESWAI